MGHSQLDEVFLRRTFELAQQAMGQVSPNPMVGAIIAKNGRIIGEGHHKGPGQPHAEVEALNSCMEDPAGATLYCNLEPCSHTNKRTPPCAPQLVERGITRVVVANVDPNPQVSGKGLELLSQAGIKVEHGILAQEGEELNRSFFKYMRTGLPFVHLKLAQGLDGKVATPTGNSQWISDQAARKEVHRLRHEYDAVMVGRHTVEVDDPSLTARSADGEIVKVPWRVVIGRPTHISPMSKLMSDENAHKTLVLCRESDWAEFEREGRTLPLGVKVVPVAGDEFLREALRSLAALSITSVLVEGGAMLAESLIAEGLFDRLTIYTAPIYMGQGPGPFQGQRIDRISDATSFKNVKVRVLGDQAVFELSP